MSDHQLRRYLLLTLALAGCGAGEDGTPEAEVDAPVATIPEAGPPLEITPLTDVELMGIERPLIVLNLPWSDNVLAKSPAPDAPRATLQAVQVTQGPNFDRLELAFGTDAPFPGYRVVWNDLRTAGCGGEMATELPAEETLLVAIEPATARGGPAAGVRSLQADMPTIQGATRVCDQTDRLVWALPAADSARVRTVELRDPPRLIVDVQHPRAAP